MSFFSEEGIEEKIIEIVNFVLFLCKTSPLTFKKKQA